MNACTEALLSEKPSRGRPNSVVTQFPSTASECMTSYMATHNPYSQVDRGVSIYMNVFPEHMSERSQAGQCTHVKTQSTGAHQSSLTASLPEE